SRDAIVGRIVMNRIPAATPIRLSDLYPLGQTPEISIAPGNRLVSVTVRDTADAVSGLIKPGNYVDVMMTVDGVRNADRNRDSMVLQLFDGVRIYAVNGNGNSGNTITGQNEVTLELTPEQQKVMILARDKGQISLSYNPAGPGSGGVSVQASRSDRVMLSEILGIESEESEEPFLTEQYRDGMRSTAYYDKDGRPTGRSRAYGDSGAGDALMNGGVPLQGAGNYGSAGWDSTSADTPAVNKSVSLAPAGNKGAF
ncbi:MAG: Flp pilus assembly protein CpaB, partial [Planctomycetaceae bacterium]|nr:Flp pilus assembly protein CpaB [Planctomycetaceae bacterium]